MQEIDNIAHKLISAKKAPKSSAFHDTTKGIRTMELVENMHDHYLPPIANKIEWLNMPKLKNEKISIPDIKKFAIAKQDTKDSCGLCSGKMVINTILHKRGDVKNISEKDISEKILLSQLKIIKDYVGITPGHLKASLQELLTQYHLSYTAIEKQFTSYEELKNFLKAGSYIIFSYMGNAIDNPYNLKDGHKDASLKHIHHPHYAVLLAIDEKNKIVTIANPFGYQEKIDLHDFWKRISLYPKYLHSRSIYIPLVESGIYEPRTCIIIAPNT